MKRESGHWSCDAYNIDRLPLGSRVLPAHPVFRKQSVLKTTENCWVVFQISSKYHHHTKQTRQGHSLPTLGVPRAAQVFYQGPNVAASAKGAAAQQERLCPQTAGLIKASPLPDYSGTLAHHKNVDFDSCLSWQKARTLVRTIKHCSNCAQCQHETVGWLTRGSKR